MGARGAVATGEDFLKSFSHCCSEHLPQTGKEQHQSTQVVVEKVQQETDWYQCCCEESVNVTVWREFYLSLIFSKLFFYHFTVNMKRAVLYCVWNYIHSQQYMHITITGLLSWILHSTVPIVKGSEIAI